MLTLALTIEERRLKSACSRRGLVQFYGYGRPSVRFEAGRSTLTQKTLVYQLIEERHFHGRPPFGRWNFGGGTLLVAFIGGRSLNSRRRVGSNSRIEAEVRGREMDPYRNRLP